jgi:ABC-2 type transport system ATP-binding protein
MASHLLDEVQKVCSHVAVLSRGKKLFDGEVSEVLAISDSYELGARDIEALAAAIRTFRGFRSCNSTGDRLQVYFSEEVRPEELNQFLFSRGVILTHLSERKRSLEQHFLELLHDNA